MKKLFVILYCTTALYGHNNEIIKRSYDALSIGISGISSEQKAVVKKIVRELQTESMNSLDGLDGAISSQSMLSLYMMPHVQPMATIKTAVASLLYYSYAHAMLEELLVLYDKNHEAIRYWKSYLFAQRHSWSQQMFSKVFGTKKAGAYIEKNIAILQRQEQAIAHYIGTIRQALSSLYAVQEHQKIEAQLLMTLHIQLMFLHVDQTCDDPSALISYMKTMVVESMAWLKKQKALAARADIPSHFMRHKLAYAAGGLMVASSIYAVVKYKQQIINGFAAAKEQSQVLYQDHIKQPCLDFYDALTQKRQVDFQKFKTISDKEIDKGLNFFRNNVSTTKSMIAASITDEGLQAVGYEKTEDPIVRAQQLQELCSINSPLDSDTAVAQFRKIETALKVSLPTRWGKHFKLDLDRRVDQALMDLRLEFIKFNMNFVAAGEEMIPVLMDRLKTTEHNINVALTEAKLLDEKLNLVIQVAALFPAYILGSGLFKTLRYGYYSLFKKHFTYGPIKDLLRELEDLLIVSINKLVDPETEGRIYYLTEKIQSYQYELSEKDQMLLQDDMATLQSTELSFRQKLYVVQRMHTSYLFLQQGIA